MTRGEIITKWAAVHKVPVHNNEILALVGALEMHGYMKQPAAPLPVAPVAGGICEGCKNARYCEKCGALEYCSEENMNNINAMTGACDKRKPAADKE